MKKTLIVLSVLIVLLGVGGYCFYSSLGMIVKGAIEKYGSIATQSAVTLDGVDLQLMAGNASLSGLAVANPTGFTAGNALYLGTISVTIDPSSIRGSGPITINEIVIDKPQVAYELLNNGASNLSTIQKNAQANASKPQGGATPAPQPVVASSSKPARKMIIKSLTIRNGQVSVSQEMLHGKQLNVPLPDIHLTDIGAASGGATAGQVAEQLLDAITSAASQVSLVTLAKDKINGVLQQVPSSSIGKGAVDQLGTQLQGVFGK